jgi:hypothetical protein
MSSSINKAEIQGTSDFEFDTGFCIPAFFYHKEEMRYLIVVQRQNSPSSSLAHESEKADII